MEGLDGVLFTMVIIPELKKCTKFLNIGVLFTYLLIVIQSWYYDSLTLITIRNSMKY